MHKHRPINQHAFAVSAYSKVVYVDVCCHSNEAHAPIEKPPNSAQLEDTPTIPQSYIRLHTVVWEYAARQTNTQRRLWPHNTFCWLCLMQNVMTNGKNSKNPHTIIICNVI